MLAKFPLLALAVAVLALSSPGQQSWVDALNAQQRRVAPEWEPALGVVIPWHDRVPLSLILDVAANDHAYVLATSQAEAQDVAAAMATAGIPPSHYEVIVQNHGYNQPWVRDWGAFSVMESSGAFHLYDGAFDYPLAGLNNVITGWLCNGPDRCDLEDVAFSAVASLLGASYHDLPISLTGGNFIFDGLGKLYTSAIYAAENASLGYSIPQLEALLNAELGVTDLEVLLNYESFGIQHVDCLFVMLDPERLLVMQVPTSYPTYNRIEQIAAHLGTLTNSFGRPYQIDRIQTNYWSGGLIASYTNVLILNHHVYVPLFGIAEDTQAIATYQSLMPGYQVHGYVYPQGAAYSLGWTEGDALHCRTRQVYDPQMLRIVHRPLDNPTPETGPFEFLSYVRDFSSSGLLPGEPKLNWRLQGTSTWQEVELTSTGSGDFYSTVLPGLAAGEVVEYFISAADASGRSESSPVGAPAAFYSFSVSAAATSGIVKYGLSAGGDNIASLDSSTTPVAGSTMQLDIDGFLNSSTAQVIISLGQTSSPLAGGTLLVDLGQQIGLTVGLSAGSATVPLAVPAIPALVGTSYFVQCGALDPTLPWGVALSNGLAVTIQP